MALRFHGVTLTAAVPLILEVGHRLEGLAQHPMPRFPFQLMDTDKRVSPPTNFDA